jgi:hypothetical protein
MGYVDRPISPAGMSTGTCEDSIKPRYQLVTVKIAWRCLHIVEVRLSVAEGAPPVKLSPAIPEPRAHLLIPLQAVATRTRRGQVEEFVNSTTCKWIHVIHLGYNHRAERGVTVCTGPLLQLLPPSQERGHDAHGSRHCPHGRGTQSRHRAVNGGHAARSRRRQPCRRHAASPMRAYHSSSRERNSWSYFPFGSFM